MPQLSVTPPYMPHVVVGDPSRRKAITEGNRIIEHYLGVAVADSPGDARPGKPMRARLALVYPATDYRTLQPGATFTLREGAHIVGHGSVLSLPYEWSWSAPEPTGPSRPDA